MILVSFLLDLANIVQFFLFVILYWVYYLNVFLTFTTKINLYTCNKKLNNSTYQLNNNL